MQRFIWRCILLAVMVVCLLSGTVLAAEEQGAPAGNTSQDLATEAGQVQRHEVGIILTGDSLFEAPEYQEMLKNSFVRCVNQYRHHMEFGPEMQRAYLLENEKAKPGFVPGLATKLGKDQVLLLDIRDRTWWHYENLGGFWFNSSVVWGANIEIQATLFNDQEIIDQVKVFRQVDDKYSESEALKEIYGYAISKIRYEIYGK